MTDLIQDIASRLDAGSVIPYLGPDMLSLCEPGKVPATPLDLATFMTAKVSVPHKAVSYTHLTLPTNREV